MLGLVFKWFRDPGGVVSCSHPPQKKLGFPPKRGYFRGFARVILGRVFKWFREPAGVASCSPP